MLGEQAGCTSRRPEEVKRVSAMENTGNGKRVWWAAALFGVLALAVVCAAMAVVPAWGEEASPSSGASAPAAAEAADDKVAGAAADKADVDADKATDSSVSDDTAARALPEPASFTISGKKYLVGRALENGEFTFTLAPAGAYKVPAGSKLPGKLDDESSLTAAEKYDIVSELTYHHSNHQPMPASATAVNAADGTVAFGSLTFEHKAVGTSGTSRHEGTVYCYTIAERGPLDADGKPLPGATRDRLGSWVYEGVTYADTVKRAYLYVYEERDPDGVDRVHVVPLGDATFAGDPTSRATAGRGLGFKNTFNGATLAAFDGLVYLQGKPIDAGAFDFEVHEVSEDGKLIDHASVPCDATAGGTAGAEVPIIHDAVFTAPGKYFYAIHQAGTQAADGARSATAEVDGEKVQLDGASYVVTVEVTEDAKGKLSAAITYVRKQEAGSARWVDVDLSENASPVVWDNKIVAADEGDGDASAPDEGEGSDRPDDGTAEKPGGGTTAGSGKPEAVPGDTDGAESGNAPGEGDGSSDGSKPEDGAQQGAGTATGEGSGAENPSGEGDNASGSSDSAASNNNAGAPDSKGDSATTDAAKANGMLGQTGDALVPLMVTLGIIVALAVVLLVVARRQSHR